MVRRAVAQGAHLVKPLPSMRTTSQQCGSSASAVSKARTYSKRDFASVARGRAPRRHRRGAPARRKGNTLLPHYWRKPQPSAGRTVCRTTRGARRARFRQSASAPCGVSQAAAGVAARAARAPGLWALLVWHNCLPAVRRGAAPTRVRPPGSGRRAAAAPSAGTPPLLSGVAPPAKVRRLSVSWVHAPVCPPQRTFASICVLARWADTCRRPRRAQRARQAAGEAPEPRRRQGDTVRGVPPALATRAARASRSPTSVAVP